MNRKVKVKIYAPKKEIKANSKTEITLTDEVFVNEIISIGINQGTWNKSVVNDSMFCNVFKFKEIAKDTQVWSMLNNELDLDYYANSDKIIIDIQIIRA